MKKIICILMMLVSIIATPTSAQATSENSSIKKGMSEQNTHQMTSENSIENERAKMEWNTFKEVKKIKKAVVSIKTWVIVYFITSLVLSLVIGVSKN
jgi:Ni/Co efflux regulator RcnB